METSQVGQLACAFKALGDPMRLAILEYLTEPFPPSGRTSTGICACDIEAYLGSTGHPVMQPTVSYHMKILVGAGLVTARKRGRWVYYDVDHQNIRALQVFLDRIQSSFSHTEEVLPDA